MFGRDCTNLMIWGAENTEPTCWTEEHVVDHWEEYDYAYIVLQEVK